MIKLSTDKAIDVIVEITPYISDIINDEDLLKVVEENKVKTGVTKETNIRFYGDLIPKLLKKHKEAIFIILASLQDTKVETIKKQNIMVTINQIKEIANDEDVVAFFQSFAKQG